MVPYNLHVSTHGCDRINKRTYPSINIAHTTYGIKRAIVLDFDLHHGNGTQSIVWSINAETTRKDEEAAAQRAAGQIPPPSGLKVFYGSVHDILSYPCEVR